MATFLAAPALALPFQSKEEPFWFGACWFAVLVDNHEILALEQNNLAESLNQIFCAVAPALFSHSLKSGWTICQGVVAMLLAFGALILVWHQLKQLSASAQLED